MTTRSMQKPLLNEFWNWFEKNATNLMPDVGDSALLDELDRRVTLLNPEFSWEIGPGKNEAWQFVISPNLNRNLVMEARFVIDAAPKLKGWEFYAARQPKEWSYQIELVSENEGPTLHLDAKSWTFVLLKYPDGLREILLCGSIPVMTSEERWQAAAIALEGVLGEEVMMARVDEFDLVSELESRFAERQRPIQELFTAVNG